MFTKFLDVTNSLIGLGETFTQVKMVRKIILGHTAEWEKKVIVIEEANDPSTLIIEDLRANLMAYEVNLQDRRKKKLRMKIIAFKAVGEVEKSDNEDDIYLKTHALKTILRMLS